MCQLLMCYVFNKPILQNTILHPNNFLFFLYLLLYHFINDRSNHCYEVFKFTLPIWTEFYIASDICVFNLYFHNGISLHVLVVHLLFVIIIVLNPHINHENYDS